MRKSFYPLIALFVLALLPACNEDNLLSVEPIGAYSVENFYRTEIQIEAAANSTYTNARELYNQFIWRTVEMRSDNTTISYNRADRGSLAVEQIDYFDLTASSGIHGNIWSTAYRGVSKANYILELIDRVPYVDEADREAKRGEAAFLRAFYYYLLTQTFGDVVKVTDIIQSEADVSGLLQLDRAPRAEVLNEIIIPDLEMAIAGLPDVWTSLDQGRATKGAAQTLLAKIYFTDRNYAAALPILQDIQDSGTYSLSPTYREIFAPNNRTNPEIIFANQASVAASQGALFFRNWLPFQSQTDLTDGVFVQPSSAGKNLPTQDLIRTYEAGDRRLAANVGFYDTDVMDPDNELIAYNRKFLFPPVTGDGVDINFPVFRYADVLLMKAEALLETEGGLPNEVFEIVNLLRVRAGLQLYFPGNPDPALDISTEEDLRTALRKERRLELAYENHRWWDLCRYGTLQEVMLAHGEEQKTLQGEFLDVLPEAYTNIRKYYAIPQQQVEQYGYRQNEGWE